MLGRTDSRRRLLFLLVVFGVGSLALVTRTAYWQVLRGDELTAWAADADLGPDRDRRSARRHLRPERARCCWRHPWPAIASSPPPTS